MRVHRYEKRVWLNFGDRKSIRLEWCFGRGFCGLGFTCGSGDGDDGWQFFAALPPLAVWLSFEGFSLPVRRRKCIATWDGGREFWLPDPRECSICIHSWTVWVKPWSKVDEWASADPWWLRGVSLNVLDFLFGRHRYESKELAWRDVLIPMPEGTYEARIRLTEDSWKRLRVPFARRLRRADVKIEGGIPFPGKGENAWDCGMDGLYGLTCAATSFEKAIAATVESVLESRGRYAGSIMWTPPACTPTT